MDMHLYKLLCSWLYTFVHEFRIVSCQLLELFEIRCISLVIASINGNY